MSLKSSACLYTGFKPHLLDHLASLASILDIPLILTDPLLYKEAKHFYPFTRLLYISEKECSLEFLARNYQVLFVSCKHWGRELSTLTRQFFNTSLRCIYCPHGNSDKGHLEPSTDLLHHQDLSLVYGKHMKVMLETRGVLKTLQGTITTGNYRYDYYKKHTNFYDALVEKEVFSKFHKRQPLLFYAPTWKDFENSTSFFEATELLLEKLPSHYNLLIKLHPSLEHDHPAHVYTLMGKYEHLSNVVFLSQYPLVYPLLQYVDLYLGDFSSVGYDFLAFNRPMLFFNTPQRESSLDPGLLLFRCGQEILKKDYDKIYDLIKEALATQQSHLFATREEMYHYTFDKSLSPTDLEKDLDRLLQTTRPLV